MISKTAFWGYLRQGKITATKDDLAALQHFQRTGSNVFCQMLSIPVCSNNATELVRKMFQIIAKRCF